MSSPYDLVENKLTMEQQITEHLKKAKLDPKKRDDSILLEARKAQAGGRLSYHSHGKGQIGGIFTTCPKCNPRGVTFPKDYPRGGNICGHCKGTEKVAVDVMYNRIIQTAKAADAEGIEVLIRYDLCRIEVAKLNSYEVFSQAAKYGHINVLKELMNMQMSLEERWTCICSIIWAVLNEGNVDNTNKVLNWAVPMLAQCKLPAPYNQGHVMKCMLEKIKDKKSPDYLLLEKAREFLLDANVVLAPLMQVMQIVNKDDGPPGGVKFAIVNAVQNEEEELKSKSDKNPREKRQTLPAVVPAGQAVVFRPAPLPVTPSKPVGFKPICDACKMHNARCLCKPVGRKKVATLVVAPAAQPVVFRPAPPPAKPPALTPAQQAVALRRTFQQ